MRRCLTLVVSSGARWRRTRPSIETTRPDQWAKRRSERERKREKERERERKREKERERSELKKEKERKKHRKGKAALRGRV